MTMSQQTILCVNATDYRTGRRPCSPDKIGMISIRQLMNFTWNPGLRSREQWTFSVLDARLFLVVNQCTK